MHAVFPQSSEEMRRWFLNQETELLKQRFLAAVLPDKKAFFQLYKDEFCFESVTVSVPNEQVRSELSPHGMKQI